MKRMEVEVRVKVPIVERRGLTKKGLFYELFCGVPKGKLGVHG